MGKKGATYDDLKTAFQHRNFKPLYFLFGEESFLADELQRVLIEHALAPHERDFNLDLVYGSEAQAPQVLSLCSGYPMMAERRVVVVREFDQLEDNHLFKEYAARPNPTAVVLLICPSKVNQSHHPYRALKEHAVWASFKPLYPRQIPGWIKSRVQDMGYQIEASAIQMLADYIGTDLRTAAGEIDKLITFAGGRKKLRTDDVVHATGQTREHNVFELQKALGEGRFRDAEDIAERMLQHASNARSEAIMIVSMLTAYFTKLWKLGMCRHKGVAERDMAARIGVPPFFLKEYLASLNRFGAVDVERAFQALLAADYELKGGSTRDERLVLTLLLHRLNPQRRYAAAA